MSDLSDNQVEIPVNEIINNETKNDSLNGSIKAEEVHDDHIDFDVSSLNNSDMCESDDDRDIKEMLQGEVVRKKISIHGGVKMNTSTDIKDTIKEKCDTAVQVYHEPPENVTCRDVISAVSEFYSRQQFFSSAFDLISTYVKGQKVLYTEAHEHCTLYLNLLMLPAILLSALASVFSFSFEGYEWGSIVVASINAFNGFLLSVVNYSKLDAASEAHRISSHQYDKLQSMCEFTSGCLLVLPYDMDTNDSEELKLDSTKLAIEKLKYIEDKITDIKETNNFIIPGKIRSNFTNIYYTNIFSLVKVINETESKIIIDMKNLINKSKSLEYKIKCGMNTENEYDDYMKINSLINQYHKDYIDVQRAYSQIDDMFKHDVKRAERRRSETVFSRLCCMITCWYCCGCCRKSQDDYNYTNANDILKQVSNIHVRSNKKMFFKPDHAINIHK